jgi:dolichol-phosphate mannosyltransferase
MEQSNITNAQPLKSIEKGPRLAIVIPTLEEAKSIAIVLDEVAETFAHGEHVDVVIVDGHSEDGTDEVARNKGAIVIYQRNKGYGDALKVGFNYVRKNLSAEVIVMMDADSTYDAKDIPALMEPILQDEADLVLGNRFMGMHRGSMSLTNKLGNKLISWFTRRTLKVNVYDTQSGFRALRYTIVNNIELESDGMPLAIEMLVEAKFAGARIIEVPVDYRNRVGNTKLNPLRDGLGILGTIIRLMRDTQPLTFFGAISAALGLSGLALGVEVTREWIMTGTITRFPTVMLSVLLLIGAVQFFSIGLVADMIKNLRKRWINR